ncbi:hypothetical protein [Croceimicrobium hydrocarbonivorans]|uniref:Uncharacterized protein n=1 Tax=Croceimicrobium hydrocarbonivorans TaxID=2761580 RepID=A0A7H0VH75_9FLAO|nr:hypothetical protein [Croceimicrobium hydrocarbonivorans]QNR25073.1 hypothetical protein H4K34_04285 [Croceimicrobium hydrocarbonivorans]
MRILLIVVLFSFTNSSSAQVNFSPNWKVGAEKLIIRTQTRTDYANEEVQKEEVEVDSLFIKVVDEKETYYEVEYAYGADLLEFILETLPDASNDLKEKAQLDIRYAISKDNGKVDILNWEEIEEYTGPRMEAIKSKLLEADSGVAFFIGLILKPLMLPLSSKENAIAFFESDLGLLLLPYKSSYQLGDTLTTVSMESNPMQAGQDLECKAITCLKQNNEQKKQAVFYHSKAYDMTAFLEMLKGMMTDMIESMPGDKAKKTEELAKIEEMKMEISNSELIYYNTETTWVEKIEIDGLVKGYDPKLQADMRTEIKISIEVK